MKGVHGLWLSCTPSLVDASNTVVQSLYRVWVWLTFERRPATLRAARQAQACDWRCIFARAACHPAASGDWMLHYMLSMVCLVLIRTQQSLWYYFALYVHLRQFLYSRYIINTKAGHFLIILHISIFLMWLASSEIMWLWLFDFEVIRGASIRCRTIV